MPLTHPTVVNYFGCTKAKANTGRNKPEAFNWPQQPLHEFSFLFISNFGLVGTILLPNWVGVFSLCNANRENSVKRVKVNVKILRHTASNTKKEDLPTSKLK